MLFRVVTLIAVIAAALAGFQTWRLGVTSDKLETANRTIQGQKQALNALGTYAELRAQQAERWRQALQELETYEGVDDPLNDYERAIFERVRN